MEPRPVDRVVTNQPAQMKRKKRVGCDSRHFQIGTRLYHAGTQRRCCRVRYLDRVAADPLASYFISKPLLTVSRRQQPFRVSYCGQHETSALHSAPEKQWTPAHPIANPG